MRVGLGIDAHKLDGYGGVLLAGVVVDESHGVEATSDGDVLAHAVADALLGAAALGDLGEMFPAESSEGADSMQMLASVVDSLAGRGLAPTNLDATVIAESVWVAPHRDEIRDALAGVLGLATDRVAVKGTTTDGLGLAGSGEGIAAMAVAVVIESNALA